VSRDVTADLQSATRQLRNSPIQCGKIETHEAGKRRDDAVMKRWTSDIAVLILRVAVGLIFIPHGYSKVFGKGGPAAFAADLPSYHIPAFLGYVSAYAEFFGAILLILGLLTRLEAFLLACTMAGAVLLVQLPDALNGADPGANKFFEAMKGIELPFSLFAGCTVLLLIGGGRLSLDSVLRIEERLFKKKTAE
jgi:putative oxidoreductase